MFHWAPRRIEAHVTLCVLALQVQRTAEIRTGLPWARIAHLLGTLKAVRYVAERQTIVQRTKIGPDLSWVRGHETHALNPWPKSVAYRRWISGVCL